MKREEVAVILGHIAAAYWQGRTMPAESAALYAKALELLDPSLAFDAVWDFIENDSSGFAPTIGQILARYDELRERVHTEPKLLGESPHPGAVPAFVALMAHRVRRGLAFGNPLAELTGGAGAELRAECARAGIDTDWIDRYESRLPLDRTGDR